MKKYMTLEEFFKTSTTIKKRKKNILDYMVAIGCFSIIIFSLYTILNWIKDNSKIKQLNTEIIQNTKIINSNEKGELVNPPIDMNSNYYYYTKFSLMEVDFSKLNESNDDTVAFIHIDNTNVNYPVVQVDNNAYYLKHSFDKKVNKGGWIFLDFRNDINNLSDNTIIYGHSRLDGTMFGSLKNTLIDYWQSDKNNYVIYISTPKENMLFQIFSIYTIQKENYYIRTSFETKKDKQKWLDTMKERNIASIDTDVNVDDKILTLSTCQNNHDGRIVVQAKLIKRQKR